MKQWIPEDILKKYDVANYNHAAEILSQSFPEEFSDVIYALRQFAFSTKDILTAGGNKPDIPLKIAHILEPREWREIRISGDLSIKFYMRSGERSGAFSSTPYTEKTIKNYIDGHNIDHVKGRVALDVEWNSKDQTFDRDLFAMRTYHECDIISAGIIITRSEKLNPVFRRLGVSTKYGASTTWMGKLLPRLDSRRHGACPILAIGITPQTMVDLEETL